jgi:NAD-dependent SIR2 family protein deacetylase
VFAKVRPGVMWFGEFSSRGSCSSTSFGSVCGVDHEKDFALDVGGVFEFYPTKRLIIRADAGDTIIRYPNHTFGTLGSPLEVPAETKQNFQVSIGVGWRF